MKISGFSFVRNGELLGYPIAESVRSILPVCDEFVIAVGNSDKGDHSREIIKNINSDKIKIIDTNWDDLEKLRGSIYSQQTNIALDACTGDWCFYIQCDEAVHENYLPLIRNACEKYLHHTAVEGFLFNYKHFWADYDHYMNNHKWYPKEIRIIRNGIGVQSIGDAQSFRKGDEKLDVVQLDAEVFHYGYVRPPHLMQKRNRKITANYWGQKKALEMFKEELFDFGSLEKVPRFSGTHPKVMAERVASLNWKDQLVYKGKSTARHNHDRLKYRIITFIEQKIFRGRYYWGYKNYNCIKDNPLKKKGQRISKKEAPCVSLIIAVYEKSDFLEKIFISLQNQSFDSFEIIVADDGSGPSIKKIIDQYKSSFRYPIKHVWHKDDGFRKTIIINQAVSKADAPYLVFIDGDCLLHHRFLEFHNKRKNPGDVLVGRRVLFSPKTTKRITVEDVKNGHIENPLFWLWENRFKEIRQGLIIPGIFHLRNIPFYKTHLLVGSNFSLFKKDYLHINGYDERIIGRGLEDDNLYARSLLAGFTIKSIVHEALQYHLHHSFDPVPHSQEVIDQFRNPDSFWTPYGLNKEKGPKPLQ